MIDRISKEKRSKIMSSIRAQSKLENTVSRALWKNGLRFRKNDRSLYGTPDISIKKYRLVIFIDSCFWHACPLHGTMPKTNTEFWENKFKRNVERAHEVTEHYEEEGWTILWIWEHELKQDFAGVIEKILAYVHEASGRK